MRQVANKSYLKLRKHINRVFEVQLMQTYGALRASIWNLQVLAVMLMVLTYYPLKNQSKTLKIFFLLVSYTHAQWVLNPQPHPTSTLFWEEEVPFEVELIGNTLMIYNR